MFFQILSVHYMNRQVKILKNIFCQHLPNIFAQVAVDRLRQTYVATATMEMMATVSLVLAWHRSVIGCGLNLIDGSCFYTKTGIHLRAAF